MASSSFISKLDHHTTGTPERDIAHAMQPHSTFESAEDTQGSPSQLDGLRNDLSATIPSLRASMPPDVSVEKPGKVNPHGGTDSGYVPMSTTPSRSVVCTCSSDQNLASIKRNQSPQYPQLGELKVIDKEASNVTMNRFMDLVVLYGERLCEALRRPVLKGMVRKTPYVGGVSMKLKCLGVCECTARYYIIVECENMPLVAKRARKFFSQQHVLEDVQPDFEILVVDSGLQSLCDEERVRVSTGTGVAETLCGRPIMMHKGEKSARGTVGGLIMVEASKEPRRPGLYGLTVGHCLGALVKEPPADTWSDDDVSDDEEKAVLGVFYDSNVDESDEDELARVDIGKIAASSMDSPCPSANRDWALIQLLDAYRLPNQTAGHSVSDNHRVELHASENDEGPALSCRRVVAITPRGRKSGKLSAGLSSLMVAPGKCLVKTLDLTTTAIPSCLSKGDSGSWVVDETTGEVYGHIVSIDFLGEAYVMPIRDTLCDIASHLKVALGSVRLPTSDEVSQEFLSRQRDPVARRMLGVDERINMSGACGLKIGSPDSGYESKGSSLSVASEDAQQIRTALEARTHHTAGLRNSSEPDMASEWSGLWRCRQKGEVFPFSSGEANRREGDIMEQDWENLGGDTSFF